MGWGGEMMEEEAERKRRWKEKTGGHQESGDEVSLITHYIHFDSRLNAC